MKLRKPTALLAVFVIIALLFASCTATQKKTEDTAATQPPVTEEVTVEAPEEETVSFEVTDPAGNVLSLIPIYDADAVTVIAGYVEGARDSGGNALTSEQLSVIGSIIGVTAENGALKADLTSDGALLVIEAYAEDDGSIVAMQDVKDLNQNADKEEFLKLNLVTDANGIRHYMTEYTAIVVVRKQDGSATVTVDGEKKNASAVNSSNTAVALKIEEDKKHNESQNAANQKAAEEKQENTAQPEAPKEPEKENTPADTNKPEEDTTSTTAAHEEEPKLGIVLLANRTAKSDAPGVNIETGAVTITQPGDYEITSETSVWHGQIIIKLPNTEKAEVAFRNVDIQNDTTNIIQIIDTSINEDRDFLEAESGLDEYADDYVEMISEYDSAPNVQLSFPEGTSSSFTTTVNSHSGVLYNESKLTIKGHGSAEFNSTRNPNNSICSTKSIKIRNLNLKLSTPQSENTSVLDKKMGSAKGIFSYSKITLESGKLTVRSNGDGIRCKSIEFQGGTADIKSSACDGIDADDAIVVNGGSVKVTALEKSSFKVRRINNTEKGYVKGRVRADKGDTFEINKGTVIGESKRISTVQPSSAQANITCRIVKPSAGTEAALLEAKKPEIITIKGVKSSENKCTKFLYSAASLTAGKDYEVSTPSSSATAQSDSWKNKTGSVRVISSQ